MENIARPEFFLACSIRTTFLYPFWLRLRRNLCRPFGRAQLSRSRKNNKLWRIVSRSLLFVLHFGCVLEETHSSASGKRVESPAEGQEMICSWKPFNIQVIFFGFQILLVKSMLVTTLLGSLQSNWSKSSYVSTAQTVSTIWLKQCADEFLNQEAIYLPILEADHVRMILSSTAWPHLFVRADIRILIPFK